VSRAEAMHEVMRVVDDLADREIYDHDGRHIGVMALFQSVDWNAVPHELIRDLFRLVVERAPVEVLPDLVAEAASAARTNQEIRAEMSYDRLTGREFPRFMEAN